jgi:pimeloyl-ACP methyl ester carboxylesterase
MRQLAWLLVASGVISGSLGVAWGATEAPPASTSTAASAATAAPTSTAAYRNVPGPFEVQTVLYEWTDAARNRAVPVKIYYPKTGPGPYPIIIFSHGLGGSRYGYEYLGQYWASYGYVSVHVQHAGSDEAVWKGELQPMKSMSAAAANPANAINRPLDIRFAIDQGTQLNKDEGPLKGRLDLDRVGVAGHSFGAYTTLAVAGEVFVGPAGNEISGADPRVKAAIPMSAPVPGRKENLDKAFGSIRIPVFHMTGTKDDSPIGETAAKDRRLPFDHSKGPDQYLLTFDGGDHMIFSGRPRLALGGGKDAEFQALIRISSLAFWDAYLKGDAKAKAWLSGGGFAEALGKDGTFEQKPPRVVGGTLSPGAVDLASGTLPMKLAGLGAASVYYDPEASQELQNLQQGLLLEDRTTQAGRIAAVLARWFKGRPDAAALELAAGQKIGPDQVKAAARLLAESQGPADSYRRDGLLDFLCCVYPLVDDPAAKAAILAALDSEYRGDSMTAATDSKTRASQWGEVMGAVAWFGCRELLTDAFWKAMETHEYRDDFALAMFGGQEELLRLKKCRANLKSDDDWNARMLDETISDLQLALEYPAIRGVSIKFLMEDLREIPQVSRDRRTVWIADRVAIRRKQIEENKKAAIWITGGTLRQAVPPAASGSAGGASGR